MTISVVNSGAFGTWPAAGGLVPVSVLNAVGSTLFSAAA
jgi:hypothetical protein